MNRMDGLAGRDGMLMIMMVVMHMMLGLMLRMTNSEDAYGNDDTR